MSWVKSFITKKNIPKKYHALIICSSDGAEYAAELKTALVKQGLKVWSKSDIKWGQHIRECIDEAISTSYCGIIVASFDLLTDVLTSTTKLEVKMMHGILNCQSQKHAMAVIAIPPTVTKSDAELAFSHLTSNPWFGPDESIENIAKTAFNQLKSLPIVL
jgi:hypothetical protein